MAYGMVNPECTPFLTSGMINPEGKIKTLQKGCRKQLGGAGSNSHDNGEAKESMLKNPNPNNGGCEFPFCGEPSSFHMEIPFLNRQATALDTTCCRKFPFIV